MIIFKRSADLAAWLGNERKKGRRTGFVPTMGALHGGHLRLIDASRAKADLTVCSIFVNPRQFNDAVDYEKYPVSPEKDILLLEKQGADVLFLPSVEEIYPPGDTVEKYELGYLETILEGRYRPGHYQGVCQVMSRLLRRVSPEHLFMGQKDYQQCLIVKQLLTTLKLPVEFHTVPTLREPDGLAMSSRNSRLSPEQRRNAAAIFKSLTYIRDHLKADDVSAASAVAAKKLADSGFETDYIAIARARNLRPVNHWNGKEKILALIAAYQGEVRLIDNLLLN